ncbi:MAG: hypothetical protein V7K41_24750 [Nostoc sp.]|uniref:hypothetical protein n=1 Tax=Nostoc sp. TaxID=1180 RepID=UPI002FF89249
MVANKRKAIQTCNANVLGCIVNASACIRKNNLATLPGREQGDASEDLDKLRGKQEAEKGSRANLDRVVGYLQEIMKSDPNFAQEVEKLASEIQQK